MNAPLVNCPTCDRELVWDEQAPFRPFCSERCRLIDLGEWFSESRRIAGALSDEIPGDHDEPEPD